MPENAAFRCCAMASTAWPPPWGACSRGRRENVLVVASGPAFAAKWLAPRLYRFVDAHPALEIRISASLKRTIHRMTASMSRFASVRGLILGCMSKNSWTRRCCRYVRLSFLQVTR